MFTQRVPTEVGIDCALSIPKSFKEGSRGAFGRTVTKRITNDHTCDFFVEVTARTISVGHNMQQNRSADGVRNRKESYQSDSEQYNRPSTGSSSHDSFCSLTLSSAIATTARHCADDFSYGYPGLTQSV
jgi:hypothetical protein